MLKLRRWYNQNRKTIWKVTGFIVFLIALIQLLNHISRSNNESANNVNVSNTVNREYTDLTLETDKSALNNQKISPGQSDDIEIINNFFKYCNEKDINKAYELLTDECKEEMYPSIDVFQQAYYK